MSNDVRSQWADIQSGYVRDYCVLVVLLHSHTPCLQKQTKKQTNSGLRLHSAGRRSYGVTENNVGSQMRI